MRAIRGLVTTHCRWKISVLSLELVVRSKIRRCMSVIRGQGAGLPPAAILDKTRIESTSLASRLEASHCEKVFELCLYALAVRYIWGSEVYLGGSMDCMILYGVMQKWL